MVQNPRGAIGKKEANWKKEIEITKTSYTPYLPQTLFSSKVKMGPKSFLSVCLKFWQFLGWLFKFGSII